MAVVEPVLDWAATERARLLNKTRAELLTSGRVVSFDMFCDATRRRPDAGHQWVSRHRRAGRLITISHEGNLFIPSYQLGPMFELNQHAAELNQRLHAAGFDAWATWNWVAAPNPWLDGVSPEELLDKDLDRVLAAVAGMLDNE